MPGGSVPRLADASAEQVLRRLELDINRRLDGLLQGDYRGLLPGPGTEPGEGRIYAPGDDVRRIDWSLTARTTVTHVRDAVADRELETWALIDLSPSVDFGTARCEKRDLVVAATAAVAFLTAKVGNRFGCIVVQHGVVTRLAARTGRESLLALLHRVLTAPKAEEGAASTATDLAAGIDALARTHRRRGLAVVVSDFLAGPGWERPMRALAHRHDALAIEVIDPRELELPDVGFLTVVDPETGRLRDVQTSNPKLRARYADAAAQQRADTARAIRATGAEHLVLRTDRDWLVDLARFVSARRRRRSGLDPRRRPGAPRP